MSSLHLINASDGLSGGGRGTVANPRTLAVVNSDIAVALIAGWSAIAAAVLALVDARSARSEPTAANEFIALDMILKISPDGSGNGS